MRITEIKDGAIYGFTVVADLAFLTDESTAYPVSVDPTLNFNGTYNGIEDAVIYSGKPTRNYADYRYATIGYVDDSYKTGQLLVKFPTLSQSLAANNVNINNIDYASLKLYTASGKTGNHYIDTYYINSDTWNETTVTWNSLGHLIPPTYVCDAMVPNEGSQATTFNITDAVKAWIDNGNIATPDKGLILTNYNSTSSSYARDFLCTEYVSENNVYMPYLMVKFNSAVITHMNDSYVRLNLTDNTTHLFEAYVTVDMVVAEMLDDFVYSSSDESVVTIDPVLGMATAKGNGTATITATNEDYPHLVATAKVLVGDYGIRYAGSFNTIIDNDSGSPGRQLASYIDYKGEELAKNENVKYTKLSCDYGLNVELTQSGNDWFVEVNVPNTGGLAHPCGKFVIRAYYEYNPTIYEDIEFTVVCNGTYGATYNHISNIYRKFGRYIRIPHENQANASNYSEFQTMCNTRYTKYDGNTQNVSEEIVTDFELVPGETMWHTYKEITSGTTYTKKLLELIRYSEVVCILSHGTGDSIQVNTGNSNIVLTVEQIEQLHDGYFNNCKLIVLLPCSNASTTTCDTSIADAFLAKGAKAVLGFDGDVNTEQAELFEFTFWSCLRTDYSYAESGDQVGNMGAIWSGNHTIKEAFDKAVEIHDDLEVASQAVLMGSDANINAYLTNNSEDQE